ncbi:MAG: polyphosphate kinase 2 family protein [Thermoleophilaceae bacterium]|nr:polyphosphate kinase 2 family protein [Thermoleophilaceae bacterium]
MGDSLRAAAGPIDLQRIDAGATPGFEGGKAKAEAALASLGERLATLQTQLYAEGRQGGTRSLLLILQGMDTSGKGGTIRQVVRQMDPAGVQVVSFGPPTRAERRHQFLWRVKAQLPAPGRIGVFDRSHYEDVVAARVRGTVERDTWERRYALINGFEQTLVDSGTQLVKCYLHISAEWQRKRLLGRLDSPAKQWKFSPSDIDDRARWDLYLRAYGDAIERCSTEAAPWYVVPAEHKGYRDLTVTRLLIEALEKMHLSWPAPSYDVEAQRARLLADRD